ncbi:MAG: SusC/RagA family TonB-linked outer membrane protein [Cyclobacteriaceae bacterium]|nr:SusC/RagA family TonB-linked outer membrane protein [Cyclobacteriaceae bacterium]
MKKLLLLIFSATVLTTSIFAQETTITGKISDASGDLPGVSIQIKGTTTGAISDANGEYTVKANQNDVIVFSFVGYATQEITVGTQTVINITMAEDATQLSEVVVIGYGSTTIKDATGAVVAVSSEDFNGGVISSPEQLIQGKSAGVQITSTSGSPGDGVQLRIRGTSSIRSNNNPLYVVDGVPLSGGTQPASSDVGYGTSGDTNPLNFINPNDIESISILKDASATAIYGSRGANGVVIITTKSGKGSGSLEFSSSVSVASPANKYELLEGQAFLDGVAQYGGDPVAQNYGSNTDWQDYITRTSVSNKQNLAYSKGFKTGSIRASLGYEDQQGVMKNSYMKRFTTRLNGNKSFLDNKLNLNLQATYSNVKREDPPISGNAGFQGDILGAAYSANPTWSTDPDFDTGGQRSPANMLTYFQSQGATNRILTNLSADYKITDGLVAKATYGLDKATGEGVTLITGDAINAGNGVQGFGQGQLNENRSFNNLVELTLNYTKEMGSIDLEIVGGYSFQSFRNQWHWAGARGFSSNEFGAMEDEIRSSYDAGVAAADAIYDNYNNWGISNDLRNGTQTTGGFVSGINTSEGTLNQAYFARPTGVDVEAIAANYYDQTDYLQSYFARGNFTISDKYIITATLRVDGSSKFGSENTYGVFPSGAVAWKLSEEDFMPDFFSTMKLRAGYGIVGNQDGLGYGEFIRRERWADVGVGSSREIGVPGTTTQGSVNPGLKWEETSQLAAGIDFGILNEKIYGSLDFYNKQTTDLLLRRDAAQPAVANQIYDNLDAIVENKGWELSLTYEAVETEDISFSIGGNVAKNNNLVKDFAGELNAGQIYGQGLSGAYAQRLAGGYPLFTYHLREFEGFDANGQPIGDNQTYLNKSALPTWNTGASLNVRYKSIDFAAYMTGQFGHYIYNNTQNGFFTAGSINNARNVTPDVLTSGESGAAEAAVSTRFLESGNFFRMQTMSIGYNVSLNSSSMIKSLRFNLTAQNLFVITKYSGLDPEVSSNPANYQLLNSLPTAGIDYTAYPRPRTFTLGLNASF